MTYIITYLLLIALYGIDVPFEDFVGPFLTPIYYLITEIIK